MSSYKVWCEKWFKEMISPNPPETRLENLLSHINKINSEKYNYQLLKLNRELAYFEWIDYDTAPKPIFAKGGMAKMGDNNREFVDPTEKAVFMAEDDARLANLVLRYFILLDELERIALINKYFPKFKYKQEEILVREHLGITKYQLTRTSMLDDITNKAIEKYIELLGLDYYSSGEKNSLGKLLSDEELKIYRKFRTRKFDENGLGFEGGLISLLGPKEKEIYNTWHSPKKIVGSEYLLRLNS